MEENVIQINGGITINVVKKNKFGILVHAFLKMKNILRVSWMIQLLFVMKLQTKAKSKDEGTNFHEKNITCKTQSKTHFTCIFINYYNIAVSIYHFTTQIIN